MAGKRSALLAVPPALAILAFYFTGNIRIALAALLASMGAVMPLIVLPRIRRGRREEGLNIDLLFLLTHMYTVSTGKPGRRRLFELSTLVGGYEPYQSLLRRIAVIAVEWGYGFVRATRLVAREVVNEYLRGFLIRFSEVLRTGEDVTRFLRAELATALRQYTSDYGRSIELLRIFLGLYATVMSTSAFVLLTFTVLSLFVGKSVTIFVVSLIAILLVIAFFAVLARFITPRDPLVYRGPDSMNERIKRLRSITRIALASSLAIGSLAAYLTRDPVWTIAGFSLPALVPGIAARRVESYIKRLNSFFQVFVRSFGLTFSIMPNYASALSSTLAADYGPLTPYLRRLYSRITNGVDPHVAFRYFILETSSMDVLRGSNILVDTVDAGGDLAETGLVLSNTFMRLADLRRDRERVAATFETVVYLMQGLVAAIASAVVNILRIFSKFYASLTAMTAALPGAASTYLPITLALPPVSTLAWTIAVFLASLIVINSVLIAYVRGSVFEVSLFHAALLAIITIVAVKAIELASRMLFFPTMLPPV